MRAIAFDSLYNNFEMTTSSFFYLSDKNLEEIWLIVTSTKAVNQVKQAKIGIKDQVMIVKKKELQQQN